MWVSNGGKPSYLNVAQRALITPRIFDCFKQQVAWQIVVGTGEHSYAQHCYKHIRNYPEVWNNLELFRKNDTLGRPDTLKTPQGRIGFDTLRFAETLCYLSEKFDLNGKTIVELGSNYGGLAYCMLTQFPEIKAYHMIDLPQVQELSRLYLLKLGMDNPALTYNEPSDDPYLFISEYCLTEFDNGETSEDDNDCGLSLLPLDELYGAYQRYAINSQAIFIRCNIPNVEREQAFLNVLRRDFTIEVTPEPSVRCPNKLILGYR